MREKIIEAIVAYNTHEFKARQDAKVLADAIMEVLEEPENNGIDWRKEPEPPSWEKKFDRVEIWFSDGGRDIFESSRKNIKDFIRSLLEEKDKEIASLENWIKLMREAKKQEPEEEA